MGNFKKKLEIAFFHPETRLFLITNDILAFFTILSVLSIILESVPALIEYKSIFDSIEYATVFVFSLEYLGRIIVQKKKFDYIFSFFGLVDLLSIFPTYLSFTNATFLKTVRVLRILRFLRMIRLAKIARHVINSKKDIEEFKGLYVLNIQIYFFALISAITIFGALLYTFEGDVSGISSIPLGMIWAAKVLMGGVAQPLPLTIWGDIIIIVARFTGLALLGLLIFIIGDSVKKLLFGKT